MTAHREEPWFEAATRREVVHLADRAHVGVAVAIVGE